MYIFNTDLDNTIIYSYKHDIGPDKRNVEIYQGREISYITQKTFELLQKVREKMLIVPTSTRTIEQYERIDLGIGDFKYALVCNGGILLVDGERDTEWYEESLRRIACSEPEITKALSILEKEARRKFELRHIEDLFIFTKCNDPECVVEELKKQLDTALVDVFNNGEKVYVVPCALNKGEAIQRFRQMLNPEGVIAAGDSEFDISMVIEADRGMVPNGFCEQYGVTADIMEMREGKVFSESILEECLKICECQ